MLICAAGVPVTLAALAVILRKTPPQMNIYKWIIVNLTVTTFVTDFTICFLFDSLPLFPDIACYSKAWLPNVSEDANYIMLCVCIIMLQMTLCSTLVAFIYRMQALGHAVGPFPNMTGFGTFIMALITYFLGLIPVIVILITSYNSPLQMRKTLEHFPDLKFLENYGSYLVAEKDDKKFIEFAAVWLGSAFIIVGLCMVVATIIITNLHKRRKSMSSRSLELHRSLTIHLILQ
ncbi:7TM chemoreceptor, partial [Oesophagostomum dentatum]